MSPESIPEQTKRRRHSDSARTRAKRKGEQECCVIFPSGHRCALKAAFFLFYREIGLITSLGENSPVGRPAPGLKVWLSEDRHSLRFKTDGLPKVGQMESGPIPSSFRALLMRSLCNDDDEKRYDYLGNQYEAALTQYASLSSPFAAIPLAQMIAAR